MPESNSGFWAKAFHVPAKETLTAQEQEWLDGIGLKIAERTLCTPAILFLESTKPLHFVAGQAARFLDPLFSMVVPGDKLERLARILEKRSGAEFLIRSIEKHERKTD